ncbi:hypothetical protein ACJIZ3_008898 [Penstemon smallii]|uniref:Uncharacterized protein n=1 Tax=Penstemon smallii TaxID=265156 RepID=A0ABD3TBH7_9LAMI
MDFIFQVELLCPVNVKGKRGLTIGLNTEKYTRKYGVKPTIIIPEGINKPVGLHASKHASLIGALIKREAPMQVEGWSKIPNETKEELFKKLTVSGVVLAKQRIYDKLGDRKEDWLCLCEFWETEEFQKISETQSNNRAKKTHQHKLGTKSRAAHQYEKNLDDIDMYEVEYHNEKNGWADEEVENNSVKMKELREQQNALPEDATRMTTEQICISVLGESSAYVKSKGLKRKKLVGENTSHSESANHQAQLEEELSNAKAELDAQKNTMTTLLHFLEKMTGQSVSDILNQQDCFRYTILQWSAI